MANRCTRKRDQRMHFLLMWMIGKEIQDPQKIAFDTSME
jgi:hypothetical protein